MQGLVRGPFMPADAGIQGGCGKHWDGTRYSGLGRNDGCVWGTAAQKQWARRRPGTRSRKLPNIRQRYWIPACAGCLPASR